MAFGNGRTQVEIVNKNSTPLKIEDNGAMAVAPTTSTGGELASEETLLALLTAIQANTEDGEILIVKDTANDVIVVQVREYDKETDTWTVRYENVGGGDYAPTLSPTYEYVDASAAMAAVQIAIEAATGADNTAHGALQAGQRALGTDGTKDRHLKTDTDGHLQIDILESVLPTGAATETTLNNLRLKLNDLETKFDSVTRTPSLTTVSGAATTNVASGARSVTFFNAGNNNVTVAGGTLKPGLSVTFTAGAEDDVLAAIPYVTIAASELVITELR